MLRVPHKSVLHREVAEVFKKSHRNIIVDATFGAGGHTRSFLRDFPNARVFGVDRDPTVRSFAVKLAEEFGDRFQLLRGKYSDLLPLLQDKGVSAVSGVLFDIGVSSMQLDTAQRGFSFQYAMSSVRVAVLLICCRDEKDGPLDMRMDPEDEVETAADVVNTYPETQLADIIFKFGEERDSRAIARQIVRARATAPFTTTSQLARIVKGALPPQRRYSPRINPATKTFQALRIYVNQELTELSLGLANAERLLEPGGVLCVISFHSLEDRFVKTFLDHTSGKNIVRAASPPRPFAPSFTLPSRKAIKPSQEETDENPRARSAKMRVAYRTEHPSVFSSVENALQL